MDYAEVTKQSNVRYGETDYTDVTNVTNTDLPTGLVIQYYRSWRNLLIIPGSTDST